MVITRSMRTAAQADTKPNPNPKPTLNQLYTNRYDPYKRINSLTKHNLINKNIKLGDMFDIYNDIRYLCRTHPANKIDDSLLRPLLFSMMGIFANTMCTALKRVFVALVNTNHSRRRFALLTLAINLENMYICHRQFGVNSGFGDFDESDSEIEYLSPELREQIYSRIITPENIKNMMLFETLQTDYDSFIELLRNFEKDYPFFNDFFGTELNPNNFSKESVYGFFEHITWVHMI